MRAAAILFTALGLAIGCVRRSPPPEPSAVPVAMAAEQFAIEVEGRRFRVAATRACENAKYDASALIADHGVPWGSQILILDRHGSAITAHPFSPAAYFSSMQPAPFVMTADKLGAVSPWFEIDALTWRLSTGTPRSEWDQAKILFYLLPGQTPLESDWFPFPQES